MSDHTAHLQSIAIGTASGIASRLHEDTKSIDSRSEAVPRIGAVRTIMSDGNPGVSITITQVISKDLPEDARRKMEMKHDNLRAKLAQKESLLGFMRQGGIS